MIGLNTLNPAFCVANYGIPEGGLSSLSWANTDEVRPFSVIWFDKKFKSFEGKPT